MRLTYASAGHDPPFLIRAVGQMEAVDSTGIVLGVSEDAQYIEREIFVDHGDTIFLYTDGVTEELNEDEETFGQHRLQTLLATGEDGTPEELAQKVFQTFWQFAFEDRCEQESLDVGIY